MPIERLRECVQAFTRLTERAGENEDTMVTEGGRLLADLVANDDWLPDFATQPDAQYYRQYLLHCDPLERFSIVSFVWGPGQKTPIHDHTVWGLIGMLRGEEIARRYVPKPNENGLQPLEETRLRPGRVDVVSPSRGDIHEVANALTDRSSISIHIYGANIGAVKRHVFDSKTAQPKEFISGYSSGVVPNLWDRSTKRL